MTRFLPIPCSDDIDVWANHYAMIAEESYQPPDIGFMNRNLGDRVEAELDDIRQKMDIKFGEYATQQAIKRAHEILKMMGFHKEN